MQVLVDAGLLGQPLWQSIALQPIGTPLGSTTVTDINQGFLQSGVEVSEKAVEGGERHMRKDCLPQVDDAPLEVTELPIRK